MKNKNFKNYADLAASLIVDLEEQTNCWTNNNYQSVSLNEYQSVSINTTDEQDELNLVSHILYINAKSFDEPRVVNKFLKIQADEQGAFTLTEEEYNDYLTQLVVEFKELEVSKNDGLLGFVRFN